MITIGFIELNSIAKGVEAADTVLKTADTELLLAKPVCPGKFQILFSGEVAAVKSSTDAACQKAAPFVVDKVVIPHIHEQVTKAIGQSTFPEELEAVGVMEYFTITAAIYGADAAAKAANVTLLDIRLGTGIGGKSFVIMTGEVAAVREAVAAGTKQAREEGLLIQEVVIPNPRIEVLEALV